MLTRRVSATYQGKGQYTYRGHDREDYLVR